MAIFKVLMTTIEYRMKEVVLFIGEALDVKCS